MNKKNIFLGILLCVISTLAFGGQWPVAESALKVIDPFYFTLIRYVAVAIVLSIILLLVEGKKGFIINKKKNFLSLWFFGTMAFTAYNFLVFTGQKMLGVSGSIIGSVLMALIPFAAILTVWDYKKKKPAILTIICMFIGLIGVLLVITNGNFNYFMLNESAILPIILMLLSVFAWVIYTIGIGNFKGWSPLKYTTLSCILGNISSVIVIIILNFTGYITAPTFSQVYSVLPQMTYMIFISGVIGVLTWNAGNKKIGATYGSFFMNLIPIVTLIISVIQGYKVGIIEILGASLTIIVLILNNLYKIKAQNN